MYQDLTFPIKQALLEINHGLGKLLAAASAGLDPGVTSQLAELAAYPTAHGKKSYSASI